MGQQQVLLLILVTIVVGLMTVVGINLFEQSRDESYRDTIRQDLLEAGSLGQAYYIKPEGMGGGEGTFENITMNDISLDTANTVSTYSISETDVSYFKITAVPKSGLDDITIVVYSNRLEWE